MIKESFTVVMRSTDDGVIKSFQYKTWGDLFDEIQRSFEFLKLQPEDRDKMDELLTKVIQLPCNKGSESIEGGWQWIYICKNPEMQWTFF